MAAVKLHSAACSQLIQTCNEDTSIGRLEIACFNSDDSLTLAGDPDAIQMIVQICKSRDIPCTILPIHRAFHSFHVETIRCAHEWPGLSRSPRPAESCSRTIRRPDLLKELDTILSDPAYIAASPEHSPDDLIPFVSSADGHARLVTAVSGHRIPIVWPICCF